MFYVYEHWRPDKGTCFYVGKGCRNRAFELRRKGYHANIVAKLKALNLGVEIRIVARNLTEREAFTIERERIAFWRSSGANLANQTDGGEGTSGTRWSPERLAAVAIKRRGRTPHNKGVAPSMAQRERASLANRGKPRAPELVEKTAAALRGRKRPEVGPLIRAGKAATRADREALRERFPGLHEIVDSWKRKERAQDAARYRLMYPGRSAELLRASRMRRKIESQGAHQ